MYTDKREPMKKKRETEIERERESETMAG